MTLILDKIESLIQENGYQKKSLTFIEKELILAGFSFSDITDTLNKIKKNKIKHLSIVKNVIKIDLTKKKIKKSFRITPIKIIFERAFKIDDINLKLLFLFFSIWIIIPFIFYFIYGEFELVVKTNADILLNSDIYNPTVKPRIIHFLFSTMMLIICVFICLSLFFNSEKKLFSMLRVKIIQFFEKIHITLFPNKYKELKTKKPEFVDKICNFYATFAAIIIFIIVFITFAFLFSVIIRGFYIYLMVALAAFFFLYHKTFNFLKNAVLSFVFLILIIIFSLIIITFFDFFSGPEMKFDSFVNSTKFVVYLLLFICFITTSKKEIFDYLFSKNKIINYVKEYNNLLLILILSPVFFSALLLVNGFNISNLFYIDFEKIDTYGILIFISSINPDILNFVDNLSFIENNELSFLLANIIFLKSKIILVSVVTFIYLLFFKVSNLNKILKIIYYLMFFSIMSNIILDIYLFSNLNIEKMKSFHYQTFFQTIFMILVLSIIKDIIKDNLKVKEFKKIFIIGLFLVLFFSYLYPFLSNVTWINNQNYIAIFLFLLGMFAVRGNSYSTLTVVTSIFLLFNELSLIKNFNGNNLILIIYTLATLKDQFEIKIGKKIIKFFV